MKTRWKILLCTCVGLFGQFYCYDNPSALADQMKHEFQELKPDEFAYYFNLLYSFYSLPNIILPLLFGLLVDRTGIKICIIILSVLVFVGSLLMAYGAMLKSFPVMLAGRFVFGFGGESLQVAQSALLYQLFRGHEVAFALGANLSVARAGSVLNNLLSPFLYDHYGFLVAILVGSAMVAVGLCANILSVMLAPMHEVKQDQFSFAFSRQFWIVAIYTVCVYSAILPFNNIATEFFVQSRGLTHQSAGNALSLLFLISAILTPPFGFFIDKFGNRTGILLGASVALVLAHLTAFHFPPALTCVLLGLVYMTFSGAVWPTIGLTVSDANLGAAYGVSMAVQNVGLCLVPLWVARLQSSSNVDEGYRSCLRLFALIGVGAAVAAYTLYRDPGSAKLDLPSMEKVKDIEETEAILKDCRRVVGNAASDVE